jgi:hypothetical protein
MDDNSYQFFKFRMTLRNHPSDLDVFSLRWRNAELHHYVEHTLWLIWLFSPGNSNACVYDYICQQLYGFNFRHTTKLFLINELALKLEFKT